MVPDRDVPFVDRGDPALIRIDALGGCEFRGRVSRFASSESATNRTMRTEVDLPNPDGRLRMGMYGMGMIVLEPPSKGLTVPSSALVEKSGDGTGAVFVAREARAHYIAVHVVRDDGQSAVIAGGLKPDDLVIIRYNGALSDGGPVALEE
ncbi:MAG: efflux RND transporter periplasmic adaptor subunit [Isosphaeraceae bacterium]|nr:efflux RND transporter periplasmic adaptor subunit [Isosphaeraceae bacterium]